MIAYFDTSAIVPLLVAEPATPACMRLWNEATRVASVRLHYPEARAALAAANRARRISRRQLARAVEELDDLTTEIHHVELTAHLAHTAGDVAEVRGLRGYDAVHLAAAMALADEDLVLVTGDRELATAGQEVGVAVAFTG